MIRVVVVDDHPVVRGGLVGWLDAQPDLSVVAEAGDGAEALAMVAATSPDVVLMDLRMPGMDGVTATERLAVAMLAVAGRPPPPGIRRSISTTSGRRSSTVVTADSPSAAVPTTSMSGSSPSASATPLR